MFGHVARMKQVALLVWLFVVLGLVPGHCQSVPGEKQLRDYLTALPPIGDEDGFIRPDYATNEAVLAFRALGTNALPPLLTQLRALADAERTHAKLGLVFLGEAAKPAVPELRRLLDDPRYTEDVGSVLARLGHEGISALTNGLVSRHWEVREATAFNLCLDGDDSKHPTKEARMNYRAEAALAVATLIAMLRDSNSNVAAAAAFALGSLKERPEMAVPALSTVSTDPNVDEGVRRVAAKSMATLKARLSGAEDVKK